MTIDAHRTYHATQAAELSDLINLKFSTKRFGTTTKRQVRVMQPDGPSTDGGRKARQSVMLVSREEYDNGSGLVCGWLDTSRHVAEFKSYVIVKQNYQRRYKEDVDLSRGEYQRMLDMMRTFLDTQAIELRVSNVARGPSIIANPTADLPRPVIVRKASPQPLMLVLAAVVGFLLCYFLVLLKILPT